MYHENQGPRPIQICHNPLRKYNRPLQFCTYRWKNSSICRNAMDHCNSSDIKNRKCNGLPQSATYLKCSLCDWTSALHFATRGHCIKGKRCYPITGTSNKIFCLKKVPTLAFNQIVSLVAAKIFVLCHFTHFQESLIALNQPLRYLLSWSLHVLQEDGGRFPFKKMSTENAFSPIKS